MYCIVFLVKKKAGMSQDDFVRYWINEHTPLTAKVPGVREYRCFPMVESGADDAPFDAIAYLAFDDEAAWKRAQASPELAAAIADAPAFQTTSETKSFYAEMFTIV